MSTTSEAEDRGWNLHFREDVKQWELAYRVRPGVWRKHRVPRVVGTALQAEKYSARYVAEKRRSGTLDAPARSTSADAPVAGGVTFGDFADDWTSGRLAKRHPDYVKAKRSADDDKIRIAILKPAIGHVSLASFTLDHAESAMRRLDELRQERENETAKEAGRAARTLKPLTASTRRQYAQIIHRVLAMAVYPARLITANPLPKGFLPKPSKKKAGACLFPDEDRTLLASEAVPLLFRIFYGFLHREGMRSDEAYSLTWRDLDLKRGAVKLDENKTDDARLWSLSPGCAAALAAWKAHLTKARGDRKPEPADFVFQDGDGTRPTWKRADAYREHLKLAGIDRAELFETTDARRRIVIHDTRASFVTVSLANGKSESWVTDRTGHGSSVMVALYKRQARTFRELALGDFTPLDEAIPEFRSSSTPKRAEKPTSAPPTAAQLVAELVAAALSRDKAKRSKPRKCRVGHDRLELSANGLRVRCSTN